MPISEPTLMSGTRRALRIEARPLRSLRSFLALCCPSRTYLMSEAAMALRLPRTRLSRKPPVEPPTRHR